VVNIRICYNVLQLCAEKGIMTPKLQHVQAELETAWHGNLVRLSIHARERMDERGIDLFEVEEIIIYGQHDEEIDEWDIERESWKYCVRNKDVDGRDLAVIANIRKGTNSILITVIACN
jgi:hypothetical protein